MADPCADLWRPYFDDDNTGIGAMTIEQTKDRIEPKEFVRDVYECEYPCGCYPYLTARYLLGGVKEEKAIIHWRLAGNA